MESFSVIMEENMGQTQKKVHVIGQETYINAATGEFHEMQVVEVSERDAHFQKLWVGKILEAVDALSTKRMKIVLWLVRESALHRNLIPMTVRQMAEAIGVSTVTLNKTLQLLEEHDIIRRETGRVWMNPDVVYKGGAGGRLEVLTRYNAVPREEPDNSEDPEEEAARLDREQERLERRLKEIQDKREGLFRDIAAAAE